MRDRKSTWIGFIAVVAAGALLPAIFFGEPRSVADQTGGDWWRNVIYDFQTLFAGIAAVAAATWTVFTMERTDLHQWQMHAQLIDLSLRSERLKIERAFNPQLSQLYDCYRNLPSVEEARTDIAGTIYAINRQAKKLQDILNRPHFVEGATFFPGSLNNYVYQLSKLIDESLNAISVAHRYFSAAQNTDNDDWDYSQWEDDGGGARIESFVRGARILIRAILKEAGTLASEYGLEAHVPKGTFFRGEERLS